LQKYYSYKSFTISFSFSEEEQTMDCNCDRKSPNRCGHCFAQQLHKNGYLRDGTPVIPTGHGKVFPSRAEIHARHGFRAGLETLSPSVKIFVPAG
jgi:hypothetical protein